MWSSISIQLLFIPFIPLKFPATFSPYRCVEIKQRKDREKSSKEEEKEEKTIRSAQDRRDGRWKMEDGRGVEGNVKGNGR